MKTDELNFNEHISATLLLDSINPNGNRVFTFLFSVPNIIHAEMLRHRAGSFSVSSNRAIPTNKILANDYFVPNSVGYNERGMQANKPLTESDLNHFQQLWIAAYQSMQYITAQMEPLNVHKQHANRLTMPFQIPAIVMTICEPGLRNFLVQRNSTLAQPEIHELAIKIEDLYVASKPQLLQWGEWHIPFILEHEQSLPLFDRLMIGSARSARTSYRLNVENRNSDAKSDLALAKDLISKYHLSPFEHSVMAFNPKNLDTVCAALAERGDYVGIYNKFNNIYRNTMGFMQLRPIVEYVHKINPLESTSLIHSMIDSGNYDV